MRARALANEFAKMRHLHIGLLVALLLVAVTGMTLMASLTSPDFDPSSERAWSTLLKGIGQASTMIAPLLIAVLASRQVDIEHQSGGWLAQATAGVTPGALCRTKLLALGLLVVGTTVVTGLIAVGTGMLVGISAPVPLARWAGVVGAVLVVDLVVLALHVVLAARVENQLVGIGVGLLGVVLATFGSAVPAWIAHLTPWGYYSLSAGAGYVDGALVALTPSYLSVGALGVVAAAGFFLFTRSFDRQDA